MIIVEQTYMITERHILVIAVRRILVIKVQDMFLITVQHNLNDYSTAHVCGHTLF